MPTLALNIRMQGKLAVIIGGGAVALRKIRTLLQTGASIRVVATTICQEINAMHESGVLDAKISCYAPSDLDKAFIVIAATDNFQVNEQILSDARERGILANIVDNPASGDCVFPAVLQRGNLEIAVSTSGTCPTFAVDVRNVIAGLIGNEYGTILDRIVVEREKLLTNRSPSTYNTQVLRSLAALMLAELTEHKETSP